MGPLSLPNNDSNNDKSLTHTPTHTHDLQVFQAEDALVVRALDELLHKANMPDAIKKYALLLNRDRSDLLFLERLLRLEVSMTRMFVVALRCIVLYWVVLGYIVLYWVALDWIGLDWREDVVRSVAWLIRRLTKGSPFLLFV